METPGRRLRHALALVAGLMLWLGRPGGWAQEAERPLTPGDTRHFDYEVRLDCFTEAPLAPEGDVERVAVTFPSPIPSGIAENDTVLCVLHRTKAEGPRPTMVVLHELGATDGRTVRDLATRLARDGYHALTLTLPYHMTRRPAGKSSADLMIGADLPQVVKAFRQAVVDIRRSVDWLAQRPDVDRDRIGVMGVSLGGILTLLSSRVEPRFKAAVSVIGSGDLASVVWDGLLTRGIRSNLEAQGVTKDSLGQALAPVEPMMYAQCNPACRVMMISGRLDLVIPPGPTQRTWEAFGQPKIVWLWAGHYDIALQWDRVYRECVGFLGGA